MIQIIVTWEYIMDTAKRCGQLRQEGKEEEANEIEADLKRTIKEAEGIRIADTVLALMGEKKRR